MLKSCFEVHLRKKYAIVIRNMYLKAHNAEVKCPLEALNNYISLYYYCWCINVQAFSHFIDCLVSKK